MIDDIDAMAPWEHWALLVAVCCGLAIVALVAGPVWLARRVWTAIAQPARRGE